MSPRSEAPTPPEGLPDDIVADLDQLTPEELRKTIIHARELLQSHEEVESPVGPNAGEDIIRVDEREGYTEVVKQVTCGEGCEDCPHGPYLYHVREEQRPEGGTHTNWTFLGEVESDNGEL
ncbi:MAG: hypothetical protein V5A55_05245 [Halovenus sp.]